MLPPRLPSASATRGSRTGLGRSLDSRTLDSAACPRPSPRSCPAAHPAELASGCILALVGVPRASGAGRGSCGQVPGRPPGILWPVRAAPADVSREAETPRTVRDCAAFSSFHPLRPGRPRRDLMLELLGRFCQASPALPSNGLEVSALRQRFADLWGFCSCFLIIPL